MNFQQKPSPPRNPLRETTPKDRSKMLRNHPKWPAFLNIFGKRLMTLSPELHPVFLQLLDEADKL